MKKSKINAKAVTDQITSWLNHYCSINGIKGLVVGVSGGIDSAVVSELCARTGLPTICLEMPIHQNPSHLTRSKVHIDRLTKSHSNVSRIYIDLTETFDTFSEELFDKDGTTNFQRTPKNLFAEANLRSRLRMNTLYYYATFFGYLVVGTGNKVEDFGIGFFTKYGDGGVDVSPIANLYKSDVYALGRYLGIDESIMRAAPTDGLFGDSRTDEDQIGASYEELEWAMEFIRRDPNYDVETFSSLEPRKQEVLVIYKKLNSANQHKMNPIPVCYIPEEFLNR